MTCSNCNCEKCNIKKLTPGLKKCKMCNEVKDILNFQTNGKNKKGQLTRKPMCQDCRKIKNAEYYQKRKEKKINQTQVHPDSPQP
jgi:RecJ-like exonuclease